MTSPKMKFKPNKLWIAGGAVAVGAFIYYRRKQAQTAAASTATSTPTDPNIDPTTGQPYASEYTSDPYGTNSGYSLGGYSDPGTGAYITGGGAYPINNGGNTILAPSTNASWAQQVEAYLQGQGYDPMAVGSALGHFLNGVALSADEASIVETGMAFFGAPPQGAPPLHLQPPSGQSGGGNGGSGNGGGGGSTQLPAPHLGAVNHNTIDWTPVPGASRYHVYMNGHALTETTATTLVVQNGVTNGKGTPNRFQVAAVDSHGHVSSNASNTVSL